MCKYVYRTIPKQMEQDRFSITWYMYIYISNLSVDPFVNGSKFELRNLKLYIVSQFARLQRGIQTAGAKNCGTSS